MAMSDDAPVCPDCGADWVRSGPYYNILGELSDMRSGEAAQEYYRNRERYDARSVRKFACGNCVIVEGESDE